MPSVRFLVDDMCANFTERLLYGLVETALSERPCTIDDIAQRIADKDRTLDIKSARKLAEAAVETLWQTDQVMLDGDLVCSARTAPR